MSILGTKGGLRMNKLNIKQFFKSYGYWVALAVSVIILITTITLAIVRNTTPMTGEVNNVPVAGSEIVFSNPVSEIELRKDYSNTALQYSNTLKLWQAHKAIDLAVEEGSEVYAVMDGVIKEVTYNYLMGNIVKLDVGGGIVVVYASLASDIPVKVGDQVTKGSVIGKASATAKSESVDGPHLHLEVLLDNESVDPNIYLDLENK